MNGDNLKHFRDEWVRELDNKLKRPREEHHHYFYDDRNHARIEDNGTAVYAKKHINSERNREITLEGDAKDYDNTGSCLDLGNYKERISQRNKPEKEDSYSNIKKAKKETKENFLDILIADIDELISLPFFDLELPREIAIKIFQYLNVADLGNCARVNKKWKILADDDLIWFNLCKSRGFVNDDSCLLEREGWKEIFKVESNSAKCFHQNWKQRICQISELEYEKGGILYAASVFNNSVIAGYANGLIKLWDIFSESPLASFGTLLSDTESDRYSSITCVNGNSSIVTAGYSNGDVKVWQNGLDFPLVESFSFDSKIDAVSIAPKSASLIASSGNKFRIIAANENGQWSNVFERTLDQNIRSTYLYDGVDCPSMVHTQSCVHLYGKDGVKHELESLDNSICAEISAVSCTDSIISLGVTPSGFSILDGYRIKAFSAENGCLVKLMMGPQCRLSCLSMASKKIDILAAGCSDKRIRVHDTRLESPVVVLKGLAAVPCSLQLDEWKVIAGDMKGCISVWDQRTRNLLWQTGMRHPVRVCQLVGPCLVCVSLPIDRNPKETLWYMDDLIQHRRHRGAIRIYDFTADNSTIGIPKICQSNYDDYAGYNYNINLAMPYDVIDT